jgi:cyclopropane fatty-acyl-phospholipid synthase-like methyltransferase
MLATQFRRVTAIDISKKAVSLARQRNKFNPNVSIQRSDARYFRSGIRFDVIVCAEMLYYIGPKDLRLFWQQLDRHLSADGMVVFVYLDVASHMFREIAVLAEGFNIIYKRLFYPGAAGAYCIAVFARKSVTYTQRGYGSGRFALREEAQGPSRLT